MKEDGNWPRKLQIPIWKKPFKDDKDTFQVALLLLGKG